MEQDNDDLSIYNFNSIINYVKNNFIQILLLFVVIVIIYIVDRISNFNALIFAPITTIPVMATQAHIQTLKKIKLPKNRNKFKK